MKAIVLWKQISIELNIFQAPVLFQRVLLRFQRRCFFLKEFRFSLQRSLMGPSFRQWPGHAQEDDIWCKSQHNWSNLNWCPLQHFLLWATHSSVRDLLGYTHLLELRRGSRQLWMKLGRSARHGCRRRKWWTRSYNRTTRWSCTTRYSSLGHGYSHCISWLNIADDVPFVLELINGGQVGFQVTFTRLQVLEGNKSIRVTLWKGRRRLHIVIDIMRCPPSAWQEFDPAVSAVPFDLVRSDQPEVRNNNDNRLKKKNSDEKYLNVLEHLTLTGICFPSASVPALFIIWRRLAARFFFCFRILFKSDSMTYGRVIIKEAVNHITRLEMLSSSNSMNHQH